MPPDFADKLCLVTGGTGFIGGRVAETLAAEGARVRILARDLSKASRVGRFPVELVSGDLSESDGAGAAVEDCDYVFHCAFGKDGDLDQMRAVTVDGTRHIVEACKRHAARLVHVSTVSVYGATPDGDLVETAPKHPAGDFYAETKLEAEECVLDAARQGGLPATVVQPTIVYGPFGPAWTVRTFNELSTGRVMLIDGGEGLCNVVYVDDVVQAMRLAALSPEAIGEAFLVSGAEPITWREFYRAHEELFGYESHVERSAEEAKALFQDRFGKKNLLPESLSLVRDYPEMRERLKATREAQAFLKAAKMLVPVGARQSVRGWLRGRRPAPAPVAPTPVDEPTEQEKPVLPLPPAAIEMVRARTRVRIDKARRLLGYEPAFDFPAGMQRIAAWARWSGLVPAEPVDLGTS